MNRKYRTRPISQSSNLEEQYPQVAGWLRDGWIEIGDQEGFGFVARALDCGGLVFEDKKARTLTEALAALEKGITKHLENT